MSKIFEVIFEKLVDKDTKEMLNSIVQILLMFVLIAVLMSPMILHKIWRNNRESLNQFFAPKCWEMEKIDAAIYSINKCNGDIKKVSE